VPPTAVAAVAGGDEGFVFEFEASDNNNRQQRLILCVKKLYLRCALVV
jgi:hypothetical protein